MTVELIYNLSFHQYFLASKGRINEINILGRRQKLLLIILSLHPWYFQLNHAPNPI